MTESSQRADTTVIPKVELHLHLDMSLSYRGVSRLRPSVTPDQFAREYVAPKRCANLAEFLTRSPRAIAMLQSAEALGVLVDDVFDQLVADNVIYAELRFAPHLHTVGGLTAEAVVEAVNAAVSAACRRTNIEARIILCALRHYSEELSLATACLVERFRGSPVVALDLAGDEAGYSIARHVKAFRYAREQGIHTTAHAGEARGPASVWQTLELLCPERIGHGVRSSEDSALVEHLRRTRMHLEICPSSNMQLVESIARWPDHPIGRLYAAGVSLNVNCDNRMLNDTCLEAEYAHVVEHFGWSSGDFWFTNRSALEHAFVDDETKQRLIARLDRAMAEQRRPSEDRPAP